jgi:hypothetical protein
MRRQVNIALPRLGESQETISSPDLRPLQAPASVVMAQPKTLPWIAPCALGSLSLGYVYSKRHRLQLVLMFATTTWPQVTVAPLIHLPGQELGNGV